MSKNYYKRKCWVCGEEISTAGWAWASHQKMHVRKGELVQTESNPINQRWGWYNHTTAPPPKPITEDGGKEK